MQHTTVLRCCNCLGLQRATHLSLPCQHTCIFVEVKLTCLVVVFLLYHSSRRLSSGVDLLPVRPQQCACLWERDGISWHQIAAIQTMVPFLWALLFSKVDCWGRLLSTFLALFLLPFLIFFNSFLYPLPVSHPCTNIVLWLATLKDGQ